MRRRCRPTPFHEGVYCPLSSVFDGQGREEGIEGDVRKSFVRCSLYVAFSGRMHFVCTMYALCMQFSSEAQKPDRSRAERTFSRFVCSVCSRFGSWPDFRLFPFKANAYNAYKCIQKGLRRALSPTADWVSTVCTSPGRKLHTASAYEIGRICPVTPESWRAWRRMPAEFGWVGHSMPCPSSRQAVGRTRGIAAWVCKNGFQRPLTAFHGRYGRPAMFDTKGALWAVYVACGGRWHGLRFPCARRWRHRPVQTARKRPLDGFSQTTWTLGRAVRLRHSTSRFSGLWRAWRHGCRPAALKASSEARFCRRRLRKWAKGRFSAFPVKSPFHRKFYGET